MVRTDHEPLLTLQLQPGLSSRRLRWLEQLSEYNIRYEYLPGERNRVVDVLSRPPVPDTELFDTADAHVGSELGKWLAIVRRLHWLMPFAVHAMPWGPVALCAHFVAQHVLHCT